MIPRERLGSRSIFVFAICLGHLGIVVLFDRSPATSRTTVEDEPIMRLTFFADPRQTAAPKAHPQVGHGVNPKGSRNLKSEVRAHALPLTIDVPADVSPATPLASAPGVDWMAEGQRVAQDYFMRATRGGSPLPLDGASTGPRLLRSRAPDHRLGDTEHFDGGEIIDWINDRCYYSNRDRDGNLPPMHAVTGLAPLYPTGTPICKPR